MVDQIIRPADLPNRATPNASEKVPVDNGSTVAGTTIQALVYAGRPAATQAEAVAGVNAVKAMTPLTTAQSISSRTAGIAQAAADLAIAQIPIYDSAVGIGSEDIPTNIVAFRTNGYHVVGDGGNALYSYVTTEPSHPGKLQSADGRWWELAESEPTVVMFGGGSTGITSMIGYAGFARFSGKANPVGTTMTVSAPLYFDDGAYIDVQSGVTLTIENRINSPRQWIFRGAGSVKLGIGETTGEDSRMVHASWFNVLPQNGSTVDQTPNINKMFLSMSQTREGVIDFDSGSYRIKWGGLEPIPRGIWLRGSGIRRTTFDMIGTSTSSSKLFRTGGPAGKITGIQFEDPEEGPPTYHSGTAISVDHEDWFLEDIRTWNTQFGIDLNGSRCEAHNIQSIYGVEMPEDSALIRITGGGCVADNVRALDTTYYPSAIVQVGGSSKTTGEVRNSRVSNVRNNRPTSAVRVDALGDTLITGVTIDNVSSIGTVTGPGPGLVLLSTASTGRINMVVSSGLICNETNTALFTVRQNSTQYIRDVVIVSGVAIGSGSGVSLTQTAGSLSDITIADAVDLDNRSPNVARVGVMSNIKVSSERVFLADDRATYFTIPGDNSSSVVSISTSNGSDATAPRGLFYVRGQSSSSQCVNLSMVSTSNITFTTGPLVDGGGTDGNITISANTDGKLYISNRSGSSRSIGIKFLAYI